MNSKVRKKQLYAIFFLLSLFLTGCTEPVQNYPIKINYEECIDEICSSKPLCYTCNDQKCPIDIENFTVNIEGKYTQKIRECM